MQLVPMPTKERRLAGIASALVGELPESAGIHAILVVIDRFTKVHHYLAAKRSYTAADVANAYFNEIWHLHGLPRHFSSQHRL